MLRLPGAWVWDFWLAHDGDRYHLFFLYASRALQDERRRHHRATIGHAVSDDLRTWHQVGDVLAVSEAPAFDDMATWTGSVVRGPDGRWWLLYTGATLVDDQIWQTIGAATSADLEVWHKEPTSPLVVADDRWYERLGGGPPGRPGQGSGSLRRPGGPMAPRRYLVIANQTLAEAELTEAIRQRQQSGPSSFYVLVPNTDHGDLAAPLARGAPIAPVPSHRTWPGSMPLTCGGPDSLRRRPAGCLTESGPRWPFSPLMLPGDLRSFHDVTTDLAGAGATCRLGHGWLHR